MSRRREEAPLAYSSTGAQIARAGAIEGETVVTPAAAHRVVTTVGWLSRQPVSFQTQLLASSVLRTVAAGDLIHALDDPPGGLLGVASGHVDVLIAPGPFAPMLIHVGRPGWWVGVSSAVSGRRRCTELSARTDARILYVPTSALEAMAADDPEIWRRAAGITIRHLDEALSHIACLASSDARLRLIVTLARLADPPEIGSSRVELPISQGELGEMAALSRNSVGRLLSALAKDGCVEKRYGRLVIDPARLQVLIGDW
jgi:CRP-like cAMP-binding protein